MRCFALALALAMVAAGTATAKKPPLYHEPPLLNPGFHGSGGPVDTVELAELLERALRRYTRTSAEAKAVIALLEERFWISNLSSRSGEVPAAGGRGLARRQMPNNGASSQLPQSDAPPPFADDITTAGTPAPPIRNISSPDEAGGHWWSVTNAMTISSAVLIFGFLTIVLTAARMRKDEGSQQILKVFGTILVLTFGVFLIVAGYTDQQIAPAMGLLGTIAGYLLGRDGGSSLRTSPKEEKAD